MIEFKGGGEGKLTDGGTCAMRVLTYVGPTALLQKFGDRNAIEVKRIGGIADGVPDKCSVCVSRRPNSFDETDLTWMGTGPSSFFAVGRTGERMGERTSGRRAFP